MDNRYGMGARVAVRTDTPKGHCRTPFFLRGKEGTVISVMGPNLDPEKLGHGFPGLPRRILYKVRFDQPALWEQYDGPAGDGVTADIFEHWLDPA